MPKLKHTPAKKQRKTPAKRTEEQPEEDEESTEGQPTEEEETSRKECKECKEQTEETTTKLAISLENTMAEGNENSVTSFSVAEKVEQMLQLLSLKIEIDEKRSGQVKVAADKFEKVVSDYDGKSMPVKKWFDIFERNAEAYELTEKQMYVQARGKMVGAAKLFLESENVCEYEELKYMVIEEFSCNLNSADVHKQLQERKKKKDESLHEYMLQMKKIAAMGDVEDVAVIHHIVNISA